MHAKVAITALQLLPAIMRGAKILETHLPMIFIITGGSIVFFKTKFWPILQTYGTFHTD